MVSAGLTYALAAAIVVIGFDFRRAEFAGYALLGNAFGMLATLLARVPFHIFKVNTVEANVRLAGSLATSVSLLVFALLVLPHLWHLEATKAGERCQTAHTAKEGKAAALFAAGSFLGTILGVYELYGNFDFPFPLRNLDAKTSFAAIVMAGAGVAVHLWRHERQLLALLAGASATAWSVIDLSHWSSESGLAIKHVAYLSLVTLTVIFVFPNQNIKKLLRAFLSARFALRCGVWIWRTTSSVAQEKTYSSNDRLL